MASVDWIPPRHGCDRWWLACTSNDSLNWLFAALAFGLIGGDHIRGMVWSRAIHKCARLAITMNVASRFCVIVVWSNANDWNGLNVWNYLHAQVDAEGSQKLTVSD